MENNEKSSKVDTMQKYVYPAQCANCGKSDSVWIEKGKVIDDDNILDKVCITCGNETMTSTRKIK